MHPMNDGIGQHEGPAGATPITSTTPRAKRPMAGLPEARRPVLDEIVQYGDSGIAYFHLQDGLEHIFHTGGGVSSYMENRGWPGLFGMAPRRFALGAPLVPPESLRAAIEELVERAGQPTFLQLKREAAEILQRLGYRINIMGTDSYIDIPSFTLRGKRMHDMRKRSNHCVKAAIEVREQSFDAVDHNEVLTISGTWRKGKAVKNRELRLLTYPPVFDDEPYSRKFFAYGPEGRMLGYVFFCPCFCNGRVTGYTANIIRSRPSQEVPHGLSDYIVMEAIWKFQREGKQRLYLGLSPLHQTDTDEPYAHSRFTKTILRSIYLHGDALFHFKGLAFHKSRYRPREELVYLGLPPRGTLLNVLGAFNSIRII